MSKNYANSPHTKQVVKLRCVKCKREYHRIFKEFENGFGFCVNPECDKQKLLRASTIKSPERLERIKNELRGIQTHNNRSAYP